MCLRCVWCMWFGEPTLFQPVPSVHRASHASFRRNKRVWQSGTMGKDGPKKWLRVFPNPVHQMSVRAKCSCCPMLNSTPCTWNCSTKSQGNFGQPLVTVLPGMRTSVPLQSLTCIPPLYKQHATGFGVTVCAGVAHNLSTHLVE